MRGIFRRHEARASALTVLAVLLGACAGRVPRAADGTSADTTGATLGAMPLTAVYPLESTGAPPPDTGVTLTAGQPRTIVLRHGPPDNALFAEIVFDSAAFRASAGRTVDVQVTPRPGAYSLAIRTSVPFTSAQLRFAYPVHFFAPTAARTRYGSDLAVERALAVGRLEAGVVTFLPSVRPATDNISAAIPGAGTYLVAAPQ